jgi:hypothetical protein
MKNINNKKVKVRSGGVRRGVDEFGLETCGDKKCGTSAMFSI